jgi:hypothetical protein
LTVTTPEVAELLWVHGLFGHTVMFDASETTTCTRMVAAASGGTLRLNEWLRTPQPTL